MKNPPSPPRKATRAAGLAPKSMAAALSFALVLGLSPAQALALPRANTPTIGQTSAVEEGTGDQSLPESFAGVLESSSTGLALSSGETYELANISFSGTVVLKITEGGTYTFHGSRPNTQIQVDTDKDEPVTIILSAVTIDNSGHDLSAISVEGDSQVTIHSEITSNLKGGAESSSSSYAGAGVYVNHDAAVTFDAGTRVVAYGGVVDGSTQGKRAAGIGGAGSGHSDSGQITIEDGCIIKAYGATGEDGGAGIGSGYDGVCHNITILGGNILAVGGPGAAGIGSAAAHGTGNGGDVDGSIQILGGTVTATGGSKDGIDGGAGIGSGASGDQKGGITLSNAKVTATGGDGGAGIGSGDEGDSKGTITIDNSTVDATGGYCAAGIGSGSDGVSRDIGISGDDTAINANGGTYAAGIGSGMSFSLPANESLDPGSGGNQDGGITISGGTINAHGGNGGIPIGAGQGGVLNGDITISGGNIYTIRNNDVAAIGAAINGKFNSTITISGGTISSSTYTTYVFGTSYLGKWADKGTVKITGGTVMVKCSNNEWSAPKKDQIVITGGSVVAVSTSATDGQGNAVYRVTLPLPDATTPISDIRSNTTYASAKDLYPDGDGNVYVYLPLTAASGNENEAYINQEGKASHYRDNHTTNTYSTGTLKMDGKIFFKQPDGTVAGGDYSNSEREDSDPSWSGAAWDCTSEGEVQATTTIDPSPGAYLHIIGKGTGPYSVTATLRKSSTYYWTATGTFTGTVLEPATIALDNLTKNYDGKAVVPADFAETDSDGKLSYVFEQLEDGVWRQVDPAEVVDEGHYRVTATTEQTGTYAAGTATQEFDILPASASLAETNASDEAVTSKEDGARTAPAATAPAAQKSTLPNTGDATQPIALATLGALGAAAGAFALRFRKNRR